MHTFAVRLNYAFTEVAHRPNGAPVKANQASCYTVCPIFRLPSLTCNAHRCNRSKRIIVLPSNQWLHL